jgi:hypothetical protein
MSDNIAGVFAGLLTAENPAELIADFQRGNLSSEVMARIDVAMLVRIIRAENDE